MLHARALLLALVVVPMALPALAQYPAGNLNHPTGTRGLIMVDKVGGRVLFFGPTGDRELSDLRPINEPGQRPHEVAISPDDRTAYVSVYGDGIFGNNPHPGHTIAEIDLASHRMVGSIDISPYHAPHGMQVDAAGRLYVACDQDHKVLVIDPVKRHIDAAIDVGEPGHWIVLAPALNKVYVSAHGAEPFISVVDAKARRVIRRIPIEHGTMGLAVSPDGRTLLATNATVPYLHIIATSKDRQVGQVRVQGVSNQLYASWRALRTIRVFYSPDGRYVLTCLPSGQINIFDATDLEAAQRIVQSPGSALMGFAFSADGKTALVGNHGQGTVSRIDLASGLITDTFAAGKGVETLAYY
jgi:DNA-binding beta-propeller fold protein YncE